MTQSSSLQFIALFNELDKYLEDVINDRDQRMNFAHKLKIISQGSYAVSEVVKKYFYELNYLGELRNQLVHNINLNGEDYVVPTTYAIQQMEMISQLIMQPQLAVDVYAKPVIIVQLTDRVVDVIQQMQDRRISFVPVFANGKYVKTLTKWSIFDCVLEFGNQITKVTLGQIHQQEDVSVQRYGRQHTILDIQSYLAAYPRSVIYLTEDGEISDRLLGVITEHDVLTQDLTLQQTS